MWVSVYCVHASKCAHSVGTDVLGLSTACAFPCTCSCTGTAGEQEVMFANQPEPYTAGSDGGFSDTNTHIHSSRKISL